MNSGCCKISISSWMDYLSIYCRCLILVVRSLLRSRGAWRTMGFKGSDSNACLSAKV